MPALPFGPRLTAIVYQPSLGAALRKGLFRLIGTTICVTATVLLTAALPQDRAGFLIRVALRRARPATSS